MVQRVLSAGLEIRVLRERRDNQVERDHQDLRELWDPLEGQGPRVLQGLRVLRETTDLWVRPELPDPVETQDQLEQ